MNTRHPSIRSFAIVLLATLALLVTSVAPSSSQILRTSVLATQFFDAIGGGTPLLALGPGALLHTPEGEFAGQGGPAQFGDVLEQSFSGIRFTTGSIEAVESLLIIKFTLAGTHTGSYLGADPTCASFAVPAVAVLRVGEERVVEEWIGYDRELIKSQLAGFNDVNPSTLLGCLGDTGPEPAPTPVTVPDGNLPPRCPSAHICEAY